MIPQIYGLGIVALVFVGLVPLVTRIGMFQLEAWWPRAWLWFLGGLLVVVLDLFLLSALGWRGDIAFALALALAGWLYFPLRQTLWHRMVKGALPDTREVLPLILELVTQGQGDRARLNQLWQRLWETVFQPQSISVAAPGAATGGGSEGLRLCVAAGPALEPLELGLPERGARLFNPADARRAEEISNLVRHGLASAEAFEHGARQERRRIASDLHDDLGAQLLTIAQSSNHASRERIAGMARQALDEMRLSVRGLAGEPAGVGDVLADWRAESVTRLDAAGFQADWSPRSYRRGWCCPRGRTCSSRASCARPCPTPSGTAGRSVAFVLAWPMANCTWPSKTTDAACPQPRINGAWAMVWPTSSGAFAVCKANIASSRPIAAVPGSKSGFPWQGNPLISKAYEKRPGDRRPAGNPQLAG